MSVHRIKKGLTLPLSGAPAQEISDGRAVKAVALVADDFPGLKPGMLVEVGDSVARGQPLLEDRKIPGVRHTAPGAGKVIAINRGARRALQSVVIELSEAERSADPGAAEQQKFQSPDGSASQLSNTEVRALLVESGLWTAFRTRPFSKVPRPESTPDAIFVTAMDTQPLAPAPEVVRQTESTISIAASN